MHKPANSRHYLAPSGALSQHRAAHTGCKQVLHLRVLQPLSDLLLAQRKQTHRYYCCTAVSPPSASLYLMLPFELRLLYTWLPGYGLFAER